MKESLAFNRVTFTYETNERHPTAVLQDLSFSIQKGEFVSIVGPSGSGKSTMFRLISGLEQPNKGAIRIDGEEVQDRLGQVGYMSQRDELLPWLTVIENAALPLTIKGKSIKEVKERLTANLEAFGLKGFEHNYPNELSGGMRQRVSFLRALLSGSNLLLLDEPFSALDAVTKTLMHEWLLEQWEETGKTVIFITHDVEEALFLSDRILLFSERPVQALEEIVVPLERPRHLTDLSNPKFTSLKEKLLLDLRKMVTI